MNISGKTILVTGGGSGIGLEIAKLLSKDNKLILVGRDSEKLQAAVADLPDAVGISADLTVDSDLENLIEQIKKDYSKLDILINNAGSVHFYTHGDNAGTVNKAKEEFAINYFAPLALTEALLPVLKKQEEAAIVNITSLLAMAPMIMVPTYSDSKAAFRSYTQSLRHSLTKDTNVKVFELLPPMVATELFAPAGGKEHGIPVSDVAQALISGLENNVEEIYVGQAAEFHNGFFSSSKAAFDTLNKQF